MSNEYDGFEIQRNPVGGRSTFYWSDGAGRYINEGGGIIEGDEFRFQRFLYDDEESAQDAMDIWIQPQPTKQNDLQRTVALFESLGVRNIEVVRHEHYQSLKLGHHNYSDDEIVDIGEGYGGFYLQFKFSLTSGNLITMGVWE